MIRLFHRRGTWLALMAAVVLLLLLIMTMQTPRAELLTTAPGTPKPRLSFLRGPIRTTIRNLRLKFSGPPRNVAISADIFECSESFARERLSSFAPIVMDQSATRLSLLDAAHLALLRNDMQSNVTVIATPSFWTFDGHPAKMSIGSFQFGSARSPAGIDFDVSARARGSAAEVTAFFTFTAAVTNSLSTNAVSIRTNLAVGARVEIPRDQHLFLLTSNAATGKRIGVILSAKVQEPKK